jgi:Kdo2-lipid IVA lauroyltransferase/acyltransferase
VKKFRYWLEWLLVSTFARIIPMAPLGVLRAVGDGVGAMVYRLDRKSRAVALSNLEAAFGNQLTPDQREKTARRSLQIFARSFLELFWTPRLNTKNIEKYIYFEDPERFRSLRDADLAAIVITPHFGNFEWGSAQFAILGWRGVILTQRFKNDRLTGIFARLRAYSGQEVVTQERSVVRLLKTLRRGRPVGLLTDLTLKMGDPAVIIDEFGLKTRVTLAHSLLHERTKAAIVPFITVPGSRGRYMVRLLPSLIFPGGTSYQEISQACWDQFEPIIKEHPEHWLWAYKHWRYRPSATDRAYPSYANRSGKFDAELSAQEKTNEK